MTSETKQDVLSIKNYDVADLFILTLHNIKCIQERLDSAQKKGFFDYADIADLIDSSKNLNSCMGELAMMGLLKKEEATE